MNISLKPALLGYAFSTPCDNYKVFSHGIGNLADVLKREFRENMFANREISECTVLIIAGHIEPPLWDIFRGTKGDGVTVVLMHTLHQKLGSPPIHRR